MQQKTYIIIGAGAAGINAARTLRQLVKQAKIIVLSHETAMPYNKCLLTKVLAGEKTRESVFLHEDSYYTNNTIELVLGCTIKAIKNKQQQIVYSINNQEITAEYTKLLIASGAQAIKAFKEHKKWFLFHSLSDLDEILCEITINNSKSCLIIGGGITGLECADALTKRGLQVTLITKKLLPNLDDRQIIRNYCKKIINTLKINYNEQAATGSYTTSDTNVTVTLENGEIITSDFAVVACGVKQNSFAPQAQLEKSNGVLLVNRFMQTSDPNIYAAGDCCEITDTTDIKKTTFLWADAVAQGITAAKNMAGIQQEYSFIGAHTVTTLGTNTYSICGTMYSNNYNVLGRIEEIHSGENWLLCYYDQHDRLKGVFACNMLKEVMRAKKELGFFYK